MNHNKIASIIYTKLRTGPLENIPPDLANWVLDIIISELKRIELEEEENALIEKEKQKRDLTLAKTSTK